MMDKNNKYISCTSTNNEDTTYALIEKLKKKRKNFKQAGSTRVSHRIR